MEIVEVEGTSISPEECTVESGWLVSHKYKQRQQQPTQVDQATSMLKKSALPHPCVRARAPRPPKLPEDDIKVVMRFRDGFNTAMVGEAQIRDAILAVTGLTPEQTDADTYRTNPASNIVLVSTPSMENAERYCKTTHLQIDEHKFSAAAYSTSPDNTVKGVTHNVPSYDTAEVITSSLVNKRNPTIIQARRMGSMDWVLIVFDGYQVPYQVYYRGAEYKCYLHKNKAEFCTACGLVGHRVDVCPSPPRNRCATCYRKDLQPDHTCQLGCALCGLGHSTGDKT
ncbi:hypothetical protein HPB52_024000 [Rhipicephalus sanguineus]|uniref:CCHC-type domain-containing protein n=1 Tax=Rhipicephalus sanguineus TaxID=34632 RepID=A0A9D4Q409_RHISA|nr:hypothetical protein HPB52_024000 [Rhipicephalus sanguineus]